MLNILWRNLLELEQEMNNPKPTESVNKDEKIAELEKKAAELDDECGRHLEANAMITKRFDENYEYSKELKKKLDEAVKALEVVYQDCDCECEPRIESSIGNICIKCQVDEALRKIKEM